MALEKGMIEKLWLAVTGLMVALTVLGSCTLLVLFVAAIRHDRAIRVQERLVKIYKT